MARRRRSPVRPFRMRRWVTARPGRPIRYGPWPRLCDFAQATRDGKRGVPSADAEELGTPAVRDLASGFDGAQEHERQRMNRDLAPLQVRASELEVAIAAARDDVVRLDGVLAGLPQDLTDVELAERRSGETDVDPEVVRNRRRRERAARRAPLLEQRDAASTRGQADRAELDAVRDCIEVRTMIGASRVARLHAYAERRIAAYQRRLLRVHPDRDRLVRLLSRVTPQLPDWAEQILRTPVVGTEPPALSGAGR